MFQFSLIILKACLSFFVCIFHLDDINTVNWSETDLFQDGGQIKKEKDIYHHAPNHIPIICNLLDPPSFYPLPLFLFNAITVCKFVVHVCTSFSLRLWTISDYVCHTFLCESNDDFKCRLFDFLFQSDLRLSSHRHLVDNHKIVSAGISKRPLHLFIFWTLWTYT